jgi:hypothetical protein
MGHPLTDANFTADVEVCLDNLFDLVPVRLVCLWLTRICV